MVETYLSEFERAARQAFSMWNRDPASPSFGSFDRQYWGWKFKDFSDATAQYAIIVAVEYARRNRTTAMLPELLDGYVSYCRSIQHRDGSFDQCYPFERTPGVVYDLLPALRYVLHSPFLRSAESRRTLEGIIDRAVAFALRTDERHAEVANHLAEYAYELLSFAGETGHAKALKRANEYVTRLISLFNESEGWFLEYGGPDPGYQTRCLRYLVGIAALRSDDSLWSKAERAALFVNEFLMPDHSLHPMLGYRSTALLYPSGFEVLGKRSALMQRIAFRVQAAWRNRRVPVPSDIDFPNAIRLAHDALDASDRGTAPPDEASADTSVPEHDRDFPQAGVRIRRTARHQVYFAHGLGGTVVAYTRRPDGTWALAAENSGYLLRCAQGAASWVTRSPCAVAVVDLAPNRWRVEVAFVRSLHDELTPLRMIFLRVLNLSLLRSQPIADAFRKIVVHKLMGQPQRLPIALHRTIQIDPAGVRLDDTIEGPKLAWARERCRLYACRRITPVHMASSRYFQPMETEDAGGPWIREIQLSAGEALTLSTEYRFFRVDDDDHRH